VWSAYGTFAKSVAIEGLADLEPAGELMLKGLQRPVPAFNLRTLRDA
jgi:hypothetical protein